MRDFALLRGLDGVQRAKLATLLRPVPVAPGEEVIREGELGGDVFLIEEGEFEVLKSGKDIEVARLGPGMDFGAMALLDRGARTATVRALGPSRLLSLSVGALQALDDGAERSITAVMLRNLLGSHMRYLESTSERTVEALRQELQESKARVSLGSFLTYLVGLMCLYGYCLRAAAGFIERTGEATPVTIALLLVYAGSLLVMIRRSGYPPSDYGLTTEGWKAALKESLVWSAAFLAAVTLLKLLVLELVPGMSGQPLFSLRGLVKYDALTSLGIAASYAVFAPAQEFVARGALQSSFQQFLVGRAVTARSIILATLLFGTTHLHMSLGYAVVALVPSVFWGIMFARQKTLVGVSVSHVLIGLYIAFLLGVPGMPSPR
jgi:CRP-like cAMP-binding protein